MKNKPLVLSIDQGTTSSRAILFEKDGLDIFTAQREFTQFFPQSGWVEHDPEEIWSTTLSTCRDAVKAAKSNDRTIAALGITNQRETTIVWDRVTGKPIYNAIVWQDRRTANLCQTLKEAGHASLVQEKTGLLLDPYFAGTKLSWILNNVPDARERAERGELAFGTVDSFLLWRLTGGKHHRTDTTNASRTILFNIHNNQWDDALLRMLDIPKNLLPEVVDCTADFGHCEVSLLGDRLPICGIAGDQHAATIGQACFQPGMIKSTYGTGCFVVLNTGGQAIQSNHQLLTTIAYRVNGKTTYAIEGSIFIAGAGVQWLRDGLGIIASANETEQLAQAADSSQNVYLVPAFTGLGAPWWDPDARGALFGITRNTGPKEMVRATLEAVAFQTNDLIQAMAEDGLQPSRIRVDGGMISNQWLTQCLADILNLPVQKPIQTETTALGAAYLAGLHCGIYDSFDDLSKNWQQKEEYLPRMDKSLRQQKIAGWLKAVSKVRA